MSRKKKSFGTYLWSGLLLFAFLLGCSHDSDKKKKAPESQLTTLNQAYEFGYPLVLMDLTREYFITSEGTEPGKARINQFSHMTKFPDENFRGVVRPNVDTLYSTAWLDLSSGPQILEVPDTNGRYYVMPLLDAWSNVYFSAGSRTTGTGKRKFLIVGPNWKGEVPAGVLLVRSPTSTTWILGRTYANNTRSDIQKVVKLQKGYKLYPLHKSDKPMESMAGDSNVNPVDRITKMGTEEFFNRMNRLMVTNPPSQNDAPAMANFAKIGVAPGATFSLDKLPEQDREKAAMLSYNMEKTFAERKMTFGTASKGWQIKRNLGRYGTDYNTRAIIAYTGLGANLDADAIYQNAAVDGDGNKLTGEKSYMLHFPTGEVPAVNAFWSLTVYGKDDFFVKNPNKRFAIGSRDKLKFNMDGSLDIYLSNKAPAKEWSSNWLPTPKGEFSVTARMYWPQEKLMDPKWVMPEIIQLTPREISKK